MLAQRLRSDRPAMIRYLIRMGKQANSIKLKTRPAVLFVFLCFAGPGFASIQIPPDIQAVLKARQCDLVVTFDELSGEKVTAAVKGDFSRSKESDWAFLCSQRPEPALLVIFSEPNDCPTAFQTGGDSVFAASIDLKKKHIERYDPDRNYPEFTHEGIGVGFGQGAITYYCHQGRWLRLPGSD